MHKIKNIVFGSSSSIGLEIIKKLKRNETLVTSRKKINTNNIKWIKNDLNKPNFKNFPKNVNNIFFTSSPYYLRKNLKNKKKNIYMNEFNWIKNCLINFKCKKFIYISSPSVYIKGHPIGEVKLKCEKYIMKMKSFKYQIWRPYNIINRNTNGNLSDHFHNLLIKKILINKNKKIKLNGNFNDKLGYSSANKFVNFLINKSKKNNSFIIDYKNKDQKKLGEIVNFFMNYFNVKFDYKFKHEEKYKKYINKNLIYSNENSLSILKGYYKNLKNEKKM